jgi:hypothetical protein
MRCFYFWLLNPPPKRIFEKGREAALEITITNQHRSCRLGVFLNERNRPEFVRLIIPDVADDSSLENLRPFLQEIKQQALTTLRLAYDSGVSFFRFDVWGFYPDEGQSSTDVAIAITTVDESEYWQQTRRSEEKPS